MGNMALSRVKNCSWEVVTPVPEKPAFWEAQVSPAEAAGLSTQVRELRAAYTICSLLFGTCAHPFPWGLASGSLSFGCA